MAESNAPRDRVVSVRFTDAEIAELETLAAGHGTTVGGYLGGIVAAETGIEPAVREPGRAQTGRYRVGSSLLRTLYDGDSCFGLVDTPEQAAMIVAALNARPAEAAAQVEVATRERVAAYIDRAVACKRATAAQGLSADTVVADAYETVAGWLREASIWEGGCES